ncbi:MAG: M23 family metallopeptidase [Bryobacteraceae bacterium]|nr:M23 family metallopeptidase [Bryobacteraceae bacterium]
MALPLDNMAERELADSFFHRRGRTLHYAIDIMRPIGDPLYAVVDGVVQQIAWSPRGGLSIYLVDREGEYRFFYCHLSKYAAGLKNGSVVQRGDLIGYVGNSGNARYSAPHLHFEIVKLAKRAATVLASRVVNPYPVLRQLLEMPPVPPPPPLPVLTNELVVPSYDQQ